MHSAASLRAERPETGLLTAGRMASAGIRAQDLPPALGRRCLRPRSHTTTIHSSHSRSSSEPATRHPESISLTSPRRHAAHAFSFSKPAPCGHHVSILVARSRDESRGRPALLSKLPVSLLKRTSGHLRERTDANVTRNQPFPRIRLVRLPQHYCSLKRSFCSLIIRPEEHATIECSIALTPAAQPLTSSLPKQTTPASEHAPRRCQACAFNHLAPHHFRPSLGTRLPALPFGMSRGNLPCSCLAAGPCLSYSSNRRMCEPDSCHLTSRCPDTDTAESHIEFPLYNSNSGPRGHWTCCV